MLASQCNIYVHAGGYKCACLKQEQELRNTGKLRKLSLPVPRYGMQADKGPHVADRQADMAGAMCKSQRQGSPMSALGLGAPKGSSCLHVRVLKWNTHKSLIGSNLLYPQCNASARYHFRRGRDCPSTEAEWFVDRCPIAQDGINLYFSVFAGLQIWTVCRTWDALVIYAAEDIHLAFLLPADMSKAGSWAVTCNLVPSWCQVRGMQISSW